MLAHTLGMDAIADGVETAQQLEQLRSLHCEYGQGYFFSRPVDSFGAREMIAAQLQLNYATYFNSFHLILTTEGTTGIDRFPLNIYC